MAKHESVVGGEAKVRDGSVALVAFGGNVIHKRGEGGSYLEQKANARDMCGRLLTVLERGYELVVTHGNGPQVGNLLMQNELAREMVPDLPLDVLVAQTEGSLGYILQQELLNELRRRNRRKYVVTMITQVVVDRDDPAFGHPTKPVGPFYTEAESDALRQRFPEWVVGEDAGRGYRRIVPSPDPKRIIQSPMVRSLVYAGNVVLALGGGGVPMTKDANDKFVGVEAVIDKDLSSALLAMDIKADLFVLLTNTEKVCLNYGTPDEQRLDELTCEQICEYMQEGHFPAGSMGPKLEAARTYLEAGGREVIITDPEHLADALDGNAGTRVIWK
ncbi:MAG: carbamate kinase [Kiritimatiellia bacterium]|jgi:carbamate kinase|nr:carbamate kinase [Kiritimatiellia bacterium]MDP6810916.1 carbamate kinase [Kiritimatiellia bacterium]MDP7023366.1 carbamate kinase [Kiritimatiellia bacterium]